MAGAPVSRARERPPRRAKIRGAPRRHVPRPRARLPDGRPACSSAGMAASSGPSSGSRPASRLSSSRSSPSSSSSCRRRSRRSAAAPRRRALVGVALGARGRRPPRRPRAARGRARRPRRRRSGALRGLRVGPRLAPLATLRAARVAPAGDGPPDARGRRFFSAAPPASRASGPASRPRSSRPAPGGRRLPRRLRLARRVHGVRLASARRRPRPRLDVRVREPGRRRLSRLAPRRRGGDAAHARSRPPSSSRPSSSSRSAKRASAPA